MTLKEVMDALESYGNEQTKKIFMNHGAKEPFFGVKVADLKVLQKRLRRIKNWLNNYLIREMETPCIWLDLLQMKNP